MSLRKLNALLLAAFVLVAPFTPAYAAAPFAAVRQDDAPTKAEETAFSRAQNLYYQKQYEQAVATAKQKAEAAAVAAKSAATQGAFYAAIALLLGAAAAFFGGRLGAPKPATLLGAYETRRL